MCTVTYIPTEDDGFVLTSNRDEHFTRLPSSKITRFEHKGVNLIAPRDGQAGGTWISTSNRGRLICLLNGAFEKHKHTPPYRKSRGIVVLDSFTYDNFEQFAKEYNFADIEPFTIVAVEFIAQPLLYEFRWDGAQGHLKPLKREKHIWSSSTLYSEEVKKKREKWFQEWFENNPTDSNSIKKFHKEGGKGNIDENFNVKQPNGVQTVSVTQVMVQNDFVHMEHDNFSIEELSTMNINVNRFEAIN